ncbi:sugar ABC transporter substrate-binding protein [Arthrobacter cryoconiti]|uniref:Sugar ABC transporter substrate-binding protein n=1 Tax=Arthrobacter cryoconiti TaxID=748907 RepID=A0ABV8R561_9MICC|nr:sugar ABC transporter substrate-binding protein [Arthrobacter cryoconiti]MCC9066847.1 sugar ABC transporter substrate-binding protein [Arthrobacter cryoconiti]
MKRISWRKLAVAAAIVPLFAMSACSSSGGRPGETAAAGGGQVASTSSIKIALITHAAPGDTFWDIVRKGAEEAAAKDNVDLLYTSDPDGGRQAQLVQQAIDQKVAGIAVSLAKPDALKAVLKKAEDAGIPVVSINSGADLFASLGAFTHFGSDEGIAGAAVGTRLAKEGVTHPICVIHEQGNVALEARCAGVKTKIAGTEILYVQGTDMTQVSSTVTAKLQSTPNADAIIGLGAPFTATILKAVTSLNLGAKCKIASFDVGADLLQDIIDGKVLFTVDQQPWLQGYDAVDALWQNHRGGFKVGGGLPVLTGPAIIDKTNAPAILTFAKEGIR